MRARKNFSYLALLSLQSAPIPRKGKRPSLNLGDDTNFFAQFECAPLSSIIRRGVLSEMESTMARPTSPTLLPDASGLHLVRLEADDQFILAVVETTCPK